MRLRRACVAVTLLTACRHDSPATTSADASALVAGGADAAEEAVYDAGGLHARGLEARAEEARRDGGTIDPACEGRSLALFEAAFDPRCATSALEYGRLKSEHPQDAGKGRDGLKQDARGEDGRLVFSIVNPSTVARSVPMRVSAERTNAFSVLAEDARGEVFELAAPKIESGADAGAAPARRVGHAREHDRRTGDAGPGRVYTTAIRLLPDGRATVTMTIDPSVVARLAPRAANLPPCAGNEHDGGCLPARLPKGRYTLHVGQLFSEIDTGPPARVVWDAP